MPIEVRPFWSDLERVNEPPGGLLDGVESTASITGGEGDMPDKGPGSKSSGKKPKGGAKPGDKKKK